MNQAIKVRGVNKTQVYTATIHYITTQYATGATAHYSHMLFSTQQPATLWQREMSKRLLPGCRPSSRQAAADLKALQSASGWSHRNSPVIIFRSAADKEGRNWEKDILKGYFTPEIKRSSSMKWSEFDLSHYFTPSAAFLLLTSISLMLPNWMDCDGEKNSHMFIQGEGCRLLLMHVKQNRWCYALDSNSNRASVKYPFSE